MPRALFSVSSKQGIVGLAKELVGLGWEIVASDGTGRLWQKRAFPLRKSSASPGRARCLADG